MRLTIINLLFIVDDEELARKKEKKKMPLLQPFNTKRVVFVKGRANAPPSG